MRAAAKIVLIVINTVWVLVGLGMCVGGGVAYSWAEQFEGLIDTSAIIVIAMAGGFLLFVGVLGFYSVCHMGCKSLQMIYGLLVLMLAIVMAAAGAAVVSYLGVVDSNATGLASADKAQAESKLYIENFLNCTFNKCCNLPNSTRRLETIVSLAPSSSSGSEQATCLIGTDVSLTMCVALEANQIKDCTSITVFKTTIQNYIAGYLNVFVLAVFSIAGLQFVGFLIAFCFVFTHYTGGEKIGPYNA